MIDADGYRRVVDYTADPVNGFNAVVSREPLAGADAAKAVAAPSIVKASPFTYAAAPGLLKAPLAQVAAPSAFIRAAPLAAAAPGYLAYAHH